jgi:hypothetical protein
VQSSDETGCCVDGGENTNIISNSVNRRLYSTSQKAYPQKNAPRDMTEVATHSRRVCFCGEGVVIMNSILLDDDRQMRKAKGWLQV